MTELIYHVNGQKVIVTEERRVVGEAIVPNRKEKAGREGSSSCMRSRASQRLSPTVLALYCGTFAGRWSITAGKNFGVDFLLFYLCNKHIVYLLFLVVLDNKSIHPTWHDLEDSVSTFHFEV